MVSQFVRDLYLPLSRIRLESYRPENGSDLDMLTNYFWDMALAQALYPTLHAVELALRNTIHTTLTRRYDTEQWWHKPYAMTQKQHDVVVAIEVDYQKKHGVPITPGRMVAELSFGFWVLILSQPYESRLWRYKRFMLVDQAFPHRAGIPLHDIHQRFNDIRFLRNRVMHYEAIYDRSDLAREHHDIHEAIRWISPTFHRAIHAIDKFPDALRSRTRVEADLKKHLGIA